MTHAASPAKVPFKERINFRLLIFSAVVLFLVGYPLYMFLDAEVSGGIKDRGARGMEVDLKAMSSFSFDQVAGRTEDVPSRWRELDGKKVILVGEMWAPNSASPDLQAFDLVYSISKCCMSGPPQVQHFVKARPIKGTVPYYPGLVNVTGTLRVGVKTAEGRVASVYELDVEKVDPA